MVLFLSPSSTWSSPPPPQLLAFVTGSDRVPVQGLSCLTFSIQRSGWGAVLSHGEWKYYWLWGWMNVIAAILLFLHPPPLFFTPTGQTRIGCLQPRHVSISFFCQVREGGSSSKFSANKIYDMASRWSENDLIRGFFEKFSLFWNRYHIWYMLPSLDITGFKETTLISRTHLTMPLFRVHPVWNLGGQNGLCHFAWSWLRTAMKGLVFFPASFCLDCVSTRVSFVLGVLFPRRVLSLSWFVFMILMQSLDR